MAKRVINAINTAITIVSFWNLDFFLRAMKNPPKLVF